ncbi:MAG: Lrp/AsnC family transcriptional regulator [Carbonactinosporaceae bacterium]
MRGDRQDDQPEGALPVRRSVSETGRPPGPAGQLARALDDVDRRILEELREDARLSMRALAERVHVSRAGAYTRVNRLLRDGVIRGFTVQVDPAKIGLGTSAYITVKIEQNSWRSFCDRVRDLPEVEHVGLVGGEFDVVLLVRARDNIALRDLVLARIQDMPEVRSTRTLLLFDELVPRPAPGA